MKVRKRRSRTLQTDEKIKRMDEAFINKAKDMVVLSGKDLTLSNGDVNPLNLPKYWNRDYIHERIELVSNLRHKMLMQFLWFTGCRITEAVSVQKKQINFKDYVITIRWQKNKKYLYRNIPMHPTLKNMMEIYTAPMLTEELIFPITRQRAWQLVKKYFEGHPHQFRHSFAVNWLRCGGELVLLSRMLGHANVQSTMEYLKIVPIDQGKELMKIEF